MTVDSKVVDRELRRVFWPALAEAGFTRRSGRRAWRDVDDAVQVVHVHSFNSYLASVLGSTTFSFSVELGVFLASIAELSSMARYVRDRAQPRETDCHVRKVLTKGLDQSPGALLAAFGEGPVPLDYGSWIDRPDLWYVLPTGSNLETVVLDARDQLIANGLPWLERMSDPREVLGALVERRDQYGDRGVILEMYGGALESPGRWRSIGALAVALGDRDLANRAIAAMSEQSFWSKYPADLESLRRAVAEMR